MIPQSQPLPDRDAPGFTGHAEPRLLGHRAAYVPRDVPTVDPRELAAFTAAWDGLDDDAIAAGAEMSADPVAYRARVRGGGR